MLALLLMLPDANHGQTQRAAISKDTWSRQLEFLTTKDSDFSNYDADGLWVWCTDVFLRTECVLTACAAG